MIYKSKLKTAPEVESYHVLDMVVENCQNDLWLFDNVIESDFVEAYEDAGILTEAEKVEKYRESKIEAIIEKVKSIFRKLMDTVKAFLDKWITKLTDFFKKDAGLYEKYNDQFMKNALNLKTKYRPMNTGVLDMDMDPSTIMSGDSPFIQHYSEMINNIVSAPDQDALDSIRTQWSNVLKERDPEKEAAGIVFESEKEETYNITDRDAKVISEFMKSGHKVLDQARKMKRTFESYFKGAEAKIMQITNSLKIGNRVSKEDFSLTIAACELINSITMSFSSYTSQLYGALIKNITAALKQSRRIFLMGAHYSEAQTEQTYAIGIASDLYVESALTVFD